MNYLPSKKFTQIVITMLVIVLGWFFLSSSINGINNDDSVVDNNGVMVFSKSNEGVSLDMERIDEWGDLSKNNGASENSSLSSITIKKELGGKNILEQLNRTQITEIDSFDGAKTADFEEYGKTLVLAIKPYSNPNLPNEGELTLNALGSENSLLLKEVALMVELHNVVANDLRKMRVPEEIKFKHLFLLNDIETLAYADNLMLSAFENPTLAIDAVSLFKTTTRRFANSIIDINNFFAEKGIDFNKSEKIKIYINSVQ